ncbi:hypothetical protein WA026_001093 [Henosepilachna vigintioctopunctata]|uniref:WH2 domain-containing protein n=1 Tax=Henosepilachna vigintioctopunctata TaxID=420089 RepID=A0AAW1V999_9CUCU
MENISVWQSDREDVIRRPSDVGSRIYRPKSEQPRRSVNRSESFSMEQNEWSPSKPVTRSKSQVAYKKENISDKSFKSDNMLKSSSLFDVSGLQSLEVMRKIQNKLNTPNASTETLSKTENVKTEVTSRKVQYTGPPSVNMSTWSERKKIPVSVKEDEDYKLGRGRNKTHSSVMINSSSEQPIENCVKIKHTTSDSLYSFSNKTETKNVTIKINGSEPISTEKNGNVLIKIRQPNSKFHEFNSDILYRHPTNRLNGSSQRPHSVAFPSDFDISRVPVVRSVELKKSFRDTSNNSSNNTSNQSKMSYIRNGYTAFSKYPSNENLAKDNHSSETISKPVFRAKSFLHPVVKGFRTLENTNGNNGQNIKNRNSWQPNSSMTLPNNVSNRQTYMTNQNVPFSKFSLRKTESKKVIDDEQTDISQNSPNHIKVNKPDNNETKYQESNGNIPHATEIEQVTIRCKQIKPDVVGAPLPPQMPKVVHKKICNRQFVPVVNPRDELLKSIRDFGGKEGLRSMKA